MSVVAPTVKGAALTAFPPFYLDPVNECVWRGDERIPLTPKAFTVLKHLSAAPGELVTKEKLLSLVWPETFVSDAVLKVCIAEIRRALDDEWKSPRFIETQHRRGYRFIAPVRTDSSIATCSVEDPPPDRPAVDSVPETRYARSGDVNIAYQVLGEGPIDLIFVMGWVSHLEYFWTEPSFARFLRRLASFSRVILFDKRGTGLSDRVPLSRLPTLEQRMEDVHAVMDAVGSPCAVICGISEGGIMSALFAATYPAKTLALLMISPYAKRIQDASYPWGPTLAERERFYVEILNNWGGPVGLEERAPSAANDPRFREWWAAYLRMGASPGAALALTKMNTEIDARDVLRSVRVPTLVLHRTGDRCLRVEEGRYVASLIPNARFVELPGIDHLPFVGDQDSILDEIEEFVLGTRAPAESEDVLGTILFARFYASAERAAQRTAEVAFDQVAPFLSADLKREIAWFPGRHVDTGETGRLALFDGPARAIRCACAIAERGAWMGLPVSLSLHTGQCRSTAGGPSGFAVALTERIAKSARPGEIIVTSTVRDLVAGSGIEFAHHDFLPNGESTPRLPLFRVRHPHTPTRH